MLYWMKNSLNLEQNGELDITIWCGQEIPQRSVTMEEHLQWTRHIMSFLPPKLLNCRNWVKRTVQLTKKN